MNMLTLPQCYTTHIVVNMLHTAPPKNECAKNGYICNNLASDLYFEVKI